MTPYSDARIYGGIGSILVILTFVPSIGWILGIAGFVLILIAIHRISTGLGEREIFTNAILSIVFAIVAVALAAFFVVAIFLHYFGLNYPNGYPAMMEQYQNLGAVNLAGLAVLILPALAVTWLLLILSGYFIHKSYGEISRRLNIPLFETGALFYLIGSITVIIMVGFLLLVVAQIIIAIAFFSIPDQGITRTTTGQK